MAQTLFQEWREHNKEIKYPFSDRATLVNTDNDIIPKELFVDGVVYASSVTETYYIGKISREDTEITMTLNDSSGEIGSASFDFTSAPDMIVFTDVYGRDIGILVAYSSTYLQVFGGWSDGDHSFTADQTELTAGILLAVGHVGVHGFDVADELMSEEIWLVGEDGIILTQDIDGAIVISLIGDPHYIEEICNDEGIDIISLCPIKTINEIGPDKSGNFKLSISTNMAADPTLKIEPISHGIKFELTGRIGTK